MLEAGIYFDEIHSFYDLNLILSSVDIPSAAPKTNYIEIPGGEGSVDLTEVHGEVKYSDRECKFTFTAPPMGASAWEEVKTAVNNALNGRVFKITLDKEPDYYYRGRCSIDGYTENKKIRQIVVRAKVNPWKLKHAQTIIERALNTTWQTILLPNSRKTVCPVIECTDENTKIAFNGVTYTLEAGTDKILDLQLKEGITAVSVYGAGTIKFTYREGEL